MTPIMFNILVVLDIGLEALPWTSCCIRIPQIAYNWSLVQSPPLKQVVIVLHKYYIYQVATT